MFQSQESMNLTENPNYCMNLIRNLTNLGDDIDPAMMAAMMATTALVARGASNEEVCNLYQNNSFKYF